MIWCIAVTHMYTAALMTSQIQHAMHASEARAYRTAIPAYIP